MFNYFPTVDSIGESFSINLDLKGELFFNNPTQILQNPILYFLENQITAAEIKKIFSGASSSSSSLDVKNGSQVLPVSEDSGSGIQGQSRIARSFAVPETGIQPRG